MSKDIAFIIRKLLLEKGKAVLPHIGTLQLHRTASEFVLSTELIHPPSYQLKFSPRTDQDSSLVDYVARYLNTTLDKASQLIEDWTKTHKDTLSDKDEVYIQGIGKFVGEAPQFIPDQALEEWYTKGLLPVKPIFISYSGIAEESSEKELSTPKDYSLKIIPFVLLLCLLTFGLKYFSENPHQKPAYIQNSPQVTEVKTDNPIDTSSALVEERDTCIVITGYFVKARHVLKMINKIEALGYQSYIEDIADGTRVGLIMDCTDVNLRDTIYHIRDKVSKDAWYLQPPITVE